ncbi:hypothetical protein STK_02504 [Sulfurisphaera tokodaii str. 7]|uniref:ArnR1-like winged helix-turn-helix domain-containing protein n=2 Tax=Sulfolobaceae TaxID=118883 RepID=Q976D4_SULTO|nr:MULTISPECIES: winged helix-turn-helix domain-containing protein [Sulfolobaceae]QXJ27139.1 Transcriptional regulator, wHTH [Saccharolobus shibatae B12]QXJ30032.1 Transcriptional regulator, wHTH [Saccharolobus shibatae B12]BAB65213.1 hypothetical protein STK_02504 [Sulfurisphaera tokodaii str. 7]
MSKELKGIPMYKILAYLRKKREAKTIIEISEGANIPYNTVRDNIYKLMALGAVTYADGKYIITEKGEQILNEFIKQIESLKELVNP